MKAEELKKYDVVSGISIRVQLGIDILFSRFRRFLSLMVPWKLHSVNKSRALGGIMYSSRKRARCTLFSGTGKPF